MLCYGQLGSKDFPWENNMNDLKPMEIAAGVHCLGVGTGLNQSNLYFVQSGSSWVLIDAAWPKRGRLIKTAAEPPKGSQK